MEIKENRPNNCYCKPCGSLHRSQFSITCSLLILKGRISRELSVNIMKKMLTLNT